MFLDARTQPDGTRLAADVCIVGAGPAGITIARELAGRGKQVVVVESGGLEPDEATRALSKGRATGLPYFDLETTRRRTFGGTTAQWAGECRTLDAADFESRDDVPGSGWPFGREELELYYERARPLFELGSAPFEADDWAAHGVRPLSLDGARVRTGVLHYSPPTHFGVTYRRELEEADRITVVLHATALELETPDPATRVSCLRAATLGGAELRIGASSYVLAGGGIENPRLLLASNRKMQAGLGNEHDLVGRNFIEHVFLDEAAVVRSPAGTVSEFYAAGADVQGGRIRGLLEISPAIRRREGMTNAGGLLVAPAPEASRLTARYVMFEAMKGRPPVAAVARLRWAVPHAAAAAAGPFGILGRRRGAERTAVHLFKHVMEQAPNPENRIVLTEDRDALGMPRVELRWRLSPIDRHTARRSHAILREDLAGAGLRFTSLLGSDEAPLPRRLRGARHHMGTTRMHVDPRQGVVDADCRVHGMDNLYVAGSSVFPTSGAANPTLTIVALALRLAERLAEHLE